MLTCTAHICLLYKDTDIYSFSMKYNIVHSVFLTLRNNGYGQQLTYTWNFGFMLIKHWVELYMGGLNFDRKTECGTVACHVPWYAASCFLNFLIGLKASFWGLYQCINVSYKQCKNTLKIILMCVQH